MLAPSHSLLRCPHCQGQLMRARQPGDPGFQCPDCHSTFVRDPDDFFVDLRERPSSQPRSLLVHERDDRGSFGNDRFARFSVEAFVAELKRAVADCRPRRIVDVGCGGGEYGLALEGLCDEYYGLEPSDIPPHRRLARTPPEYVTLSHHDAAKPLPVGSGTADMVLFIASYDHIPNRLEVLADAWRVIAPGGFLLIGMSNYGFWLKRAANRLAGRRVLLHTEHHFCVHTPQTLIDEVIAVEPRAVVKRVEADFIQLPNLPRALSWLYAHDGLIASANRMLRTAVRSSARNAGSSMIVLFQKPQGNGAGAGGNQ